MAKSVVVDLRLRDVPPELMWKLKQLAASKQQTLRAFLLELLEETVQKPKK